MFFERGEGVNFYGSKKILKSVRSRRGVGGLTKGVSNLTTIVVQVDASNLTTFVV